MKTKQTRHALTPGVKSAVESTMGVFSDLDDGERSEALRDLEAFRDALHHIGDERAVETLSLLHDALKENAERDNERIARRMAGNNALLSVINTRRK
jgi:hypothetical protein